MGREKLINRPKRIHSPSINPKNKLTRYAIPKENCPVRYAKERQKKREKKEA